MKAHARFTLTLAAALLAVSTTLPTAQAAPSLTFIDMIQITKGDGDTGDRDGYGAVSNNFWIGKYEVTTGEYAAFLNAVAGTSNSPHIDLLYPSQQYLGGTRYAMAGFSGAAIPHDGDKPDDYDRGRYVDGAWKLGALITRNEPSSGTYLYTAPRPDIPIAFVGLTSAMRFANWVNNGATPTSSTETGRYNFVDSNNFTLNPDEAVTWFLPTFDEWYRAAYYSTNSSLFSPIPDAPDQYRLEGNRNQTATGNGLALKDYTVGGAGVSAYGTYGQGGNVEEWTYDTNKFFQAMGGRWEDGAEGDTPQGGVNSSASLFSGFRLASTTGMIPTNVQTEPNPGIPEPGTWAAGALVVVVAALARWRHRTQE